MWKRDQMLINNILKHQRKVMLDTMEVLKNTDVEDKESLRLSVATAMDAIRDYLEFDSSYKEAVEEDSLRIENVINEFNSNVENAVQTIALHRKLKDKTVDRSGVNAPAYKNIDLEKFKSDFLSGLTTKELCDKYNLSIATTIKKLRELGVYKDGRHK